MLLGHKVLEFSGRYREYVCNALILLIFQEVTPLGLRFNGSKVTLLGFTGGEYLPRTMGKRGFIFSCSCLHPQWVGTPLLRQVTTGGVDSHRAQVHPRSGVLTNGT